MIILQKKYLLLISFISTATAVVLTEPNFSFLNVGRFRDYEKAFFEPFFFFSLAFFLSMVVLSFVNYEPYKVWLKKVALWYVPLSVVLILSGSTTSSYAWPSRGDMAAVLGAGLVAITLGFVLLQRFYYKK